MTTRPSDRATTLTTPKALAVWLNCSLCNKLWKAADLPMEMDAFAKLMKKASCPDCGERKKIVLAKRAMIDAAREGK